MIPSESSLSSSSDNNSSKVSPSLARVSSLKGKNNSKSQMANNHSMSKSISRDSLKLVNEKMLENGHGNGGKDENDDSEDEKLSPLLNNKSKSQQALHESVALKMDGVDENIDDDGEEDDHMNEVS